MPKLKEIIKSEQPKNASDTHNLLKEISKYLLFQMGYKGIATEVHNLYGKDKTVLNHIMTSGLKPIENYDKNNIDKNLIINYSDNYYKIPKTRFLKKSKTIADTVGIKFEKKQYPNIYDENNKLIQKHYHEEKYNICTIEAKATLSDYKNGFCFGAGLTYIIAPKNIIPVEYIPNNIGLIEVDIDNFKVITNVNSIKDNIGIYVTKRAKFRLDARFKNKDKYQEWCKEMERIIYKRTTNELIFWNNKIPLYENK